MILENLATVAISGGNSVFAYYDIGTPHAEMATDGFFDEAADALKVGSIIQGITAEGVSLFIVGSTADGVVSTGEFQFTLTGVNEIGDNDPRQFVTSVSHANKIDRDEIEFAITDAGLILPNRSLSIFVNDLGAPNKVYLCRYDVIQDTWYQELLKSAE